MASLAISVMRTLWSKPAGRRLLRGLRELGPLRSQVARISGHRVPYENFAEARRAPASKPIGYEHCEPQVYSGLTDTLIPGDYPAMFWLQQLLPEVNRLFDYGGNVGLQYYSYSRFMRIPEALEWTVCDIDPFVTEGVRLAAEKKVERLRFCYEFSEGSGADLFLVSGSLHYLESSFAERLKALKSPPKHLIVNRTPLIDGPDTPTLQDIGSVLLPCVLRNRRAFIQSLEGAGYVLRDQWNVAELHCTLPFYPDRSAYSYTGLYFVRKA